MVKRVLVCGATGFIGRNMVEQLSTKSDFQIIAVRNTRPEYKVEGAVHPIKWIRADLRNPNDVARVLIDIDIVIQAAATTSGAKDIVVRPYIHVTDNAVMNSYLLREAFERKIKHFIFFSCTVMYPSSEVALREEDWNGSLEIHPRYFGVANTKIYIEKLLEFFSRISEMKTTAIRHSNIYGPHDKFDLDRSHVFGATITKALTANDKLVVWGTGEEERDLLYVDDLVSFVVATINNQKAKYRLYNCGLGEKISIKNLVQKIVSESKKNIKIVHDLSQPSIKTSLFLDNSRANKELGWRPAVSIDEGIHKTIEWWNKNIRPLVK
jgi:nucleoside-diphosphate-sugar epimerase